MKRSTLAWGVGGGAALIGSVVGLGTQFGNLDAPRATLLGVIITALGGLAVAVVNSLRDSRVAEITQAPTLQGQAITMVDSMQKQLVDARAGEAAANTKLDEERTLRRKTEDDLDIALDEIRVLKLALAQQGVVPTSEASPPPRRDDQHPQT